jgi:hypothetical protein
LTGLFQRLARKLDRASIGDGRSPIRLNNNIQRHLLRLSRREQTVDARLKDGHSQRIADTDNNPSDRAAYPESTIECAGNIIGDKTRRATVYVDNIENGRIPAPKFGAGLPSVIIYRTGQRPFARDGITSRQNYAN